MVTRVSTAGNYNSVLANLLAAQARQSEANDRVSTQKLGSDLKAYARNAEMLTAMRSTQTRLESYADQGMMMSDKLTTQDMALNQVGDAAAAARQVLLDAIAAGDAGALMEELEAQFRNAVQGMNTRYGGKFLFAGGQVDTQPVTAQQLADLTAAPIATFFKNDQFQTKAQLDDSTVVTTGVLATELGTELLSAFEAIQDFHTGPDGPLDGKLTDVQKSFLEGQLAAWEEIRSDLTVVTGRNGLVQQRVDQVLDNLETRGNTLAGMMGDVTDADPAKAITELQAAQFSVQAAAQVFMTLQSTSLLNLLQR
jgi:flagellar hook-associated protein 3 FlgL